jgi:hypothetical protein
MDRNFFYQKRAQERQREISRELATRHLLKNTGLLHARTAKQVRLLALRIAPAVMIITILLLLGFLS